VKKFGNEVLVDALPVCHLDEGDYFNLIESVIDQTFRGRFAFVNTRVWHFYNETYPIYLKDAYLLPDGAPLRWIINSKIDNDRYPCARVPGIRFFTDVMSMDSSRQLRHAFVGTDEKTLGLIRRKLKDQYPGVNIVCMLAPEFGEAEQIITEVLTSKLAATSPDMVWVGLGAPKQDEAAWLLSRGLNLDVNYAGVGLVFEYIAGTVKSPPEWINKAGIEWAYRVFVQPRRTVNFIFPFLSMLRLVLWHFVRRRR